MPKTHYCSRLIFLLFFINIFPAFIYAQNAISSAFAASPKLELGKLVERKIAATRFCQLAYFPIGADTNHQYLVSYQSGGLAPREYTESFKNIAADSFTLHLQFSDVQADNNWRCTADGLLATQFDNNSVKTDNGVDAKIETIRSEGITLPPDSRWRAGEKWMTDYD